jgi:hypothetical protein
VILAESVTDPGRTLDVAYRLLDQASVALGIPHDVLRYRFLPWTLDRLERLRHQPNRYSWDCDRCGQAWPCPVAQVELVEAYAGDPLGLADLMTRLYVEAAADARLPPAELNERFLAWSTALLDRLDAAAAWSPTGTHNAAIAEARQKLETHWADIDGRRPLDNVPDCWAWQAAVAFLTDNTGWTPFPPS